MPALCTWLPHTDATGEQRKLASLPVLPRTLAEGLHYPSVVDGWVNDNFGLRSSLVALNNRLRFSLFQQFPTNQVIAGKQGRIFLSAHQKSFANYSAISKAFGDGINSASLVGEINRFAATSRAHGVDAKLLIVPSSPVVHAAQLPDWLRQRYRNADIPMIKVLASPALSPAARAALYFPLPEMWQSAQQVEMFPLTWFHWNGAGPRMVVDWTMKRFQPAGADPGVALKVGMAPAKSDLSHMFPGVVLSSSIEVVDANASGIEACIGSPCYPQLRPVMDKLYQMSTYRNPKAPRARLVLISDSFGLSAAVWFSRYYREVIQVSTNMMDQLGEEDLQQVRELLLPAHGTGDLLFLYHDVTVYDGRIDADMALLMPGK